MSEYQHRTSSNFTAQFVSKRSVKIKAAFSAKKAGTYQKNYMVFVCMCAESYIQKGWHSRLRSH
jgi:hypothetical protein